MGIEKYRQRAARLARENEALRRELAVLRAEINFRNAPPSLELPQIVPEMEIGGETGEADLLTDE